MDTRLKDGDFDRDARGLPVSISGLDELLQRCLIRLSVPKGSFLPDQTLGSELKSLLRKKPRELESEAYQLVAGALEPVKGVRVDRVEARQKTQDRLELRVFLEYNNTKSVLDVTV